MAEQNNQGASAPQTPSPAQQAQPAPQAQPVQQAQPAPQTPMKQCKKCHQMIPKYADTCPNCGANLKPVYKKAWFWVVLVLVFLLLFVGGCTASCTKSVTDNANVISGGTTATSSTTAAAKKYEVADEELTNKGYGSYQVSGTFTNKTNKTINYVQVTYVLKDSSGAQVGTAFANTSNLASNTPWKFTATGYVSGDNTVSTFELSEVTGF